MLQKSYAHCAAVTRREGRNFAWGFLFLKAPERRAMNALYAFARATDDLVDEETRPVADRERAIATWRDDAVRAFGGDTVEDLTLVAMADAVQRYRIPQEELLLLVDGCRDDLRVTRFATYDDTLGYCRKVAVTVGMAMLAIFDARSERAREAMEAIGYAFQLTNILRDIPEDLRRDRVYLPADLLARHGVSESQLAIGPPPAAVKACLAELVERAEDLYRRAEVLDTELTPRAARTMKVMHRIYRGILTEIRRQDYDVWTERPRVPTSRKVAIIASTVLGW